VGGDVASRARCGRATSLAPDAMNAAAFDSRACRVLDRRAPMLLAGAVVATALYAAWAREVRALIGDVTTLRPRRRTHKRLQEIAARIAANWFDLPLPLLIGAFAALLPLWAVVLPRDATFGTVRLGVACRLSSSVHAISTAARATYAIYAEMDATLISERDDLFFAPLSVLQLATVRISIAYFCVDTLFVLLCEYDLTMLLHHLAALIYWPLTLVLGARGRVCGSR